MSLFPRRGDPVDEARYVVFVPCAKPADYVEPLIASWHGGRWHKADPRPVLGWVGPLPVLKLEFFNGGPPDHRMYDL